MQQKKNKILRLVSQELKKFECWNVLNQKQLQRKEREGRDEELLWGYQRGDYEELLASRSATLCMIIIIELCEVLVVVDLPETDCLTVRV
jgi:hypothetical protein